MCIIFNRKYIFSKVNLNSDKKKLFSNYLIFLPNQIIYIIKIININLNFRTQHCNRH